MADVHEAPFGHESAGVNTPRVIGVVVGMGVLVAIALIAIYLALTYWIMPNYVQLHTQRSLVPPAPRLQPSHPHHDLEELRAQKTALLSGYVWTDKTHDFARIPIERAMQIYVQQQKRKPGPGTRNTGLGGDASALESAPGTGGSRGEAGDKGPETGDRGRITGPHGRGARKQERAGAPGRAASAGSAGGHP